ncbi:uncharacterized protein LOC143371520 [Andrena cerasifolii]|uniref:uncharacterized protein LOC143371520 n=1 Tax=Andrena cerasifolii TaxID=2819439 RepID=UPI004037EF07
MATIEEGFCRDDTDCSQEQYCYHVSERCVDYTHCSRYNRRENERRSRQPSQCGPCLPGHIAETLGTGEMAVLCKKANMQDNVPEVDRRLNSNVVIYAVLGVSLICILVGVATAIFLKIRSRRAPKRRVNDSEQCTDLVPVKPSAPQAENSPFIGYGGKQSHVPFNNNNNSKDKNKLVLASSFTPPHWVRANPTYDDNASDDNMAASEDLHSRSELQPAAGPSHIWGPGQLALQVRGNVTGYEEEMDNSANIVLIQRNRSPLNITEENDDDQDEGGENSNANHNNNNNSNNSRSTENNAGDNRERVRASNISITQKISMNVNVLNGDC